MGMHRFPKAFNLAMTIVLVIYAAVMCCGYYGYGAPQCKDWCKLEPCQFRNLHMGVSEFGGPS